ncbi:unnamed protein product [Caenorhabditis angaria]|uniref:Autophagy-related protein 13 n=1 Tax=Caenorhabditis angaria TaxID=860376 RepID=A0A9P1NCW3_9PELO|nr:unnamed protein product [Caenorhabditis angaria]
MVQQLVQARLGDHIEQPCVASPESHDWFNMKIDELGEVSALLKSSVRHLPPAGKLTVEFVLYTASGQFLPLETWSLTVDDQKADTNMNMSSDLYHQLSTLLRSVTCAARMTPMHRLYVKKQNIDSFIIMYRIYDCTGISDLGEESKHRRLAELPTQYGTVCLDLTYRTKMHFDFDEKQAESEEDDPDKTLESDETPTPSIPNRPSLSNCIPLTAETAKGEKIVTTPMSATTCNFQAASEESKKTGPKFILGQSTSSEESRNSEQPNSVEDDDKPPIALLKKNSFPFLSLLQSSYAPKEKKNSEASLCSRIPETLSENDITNKNLEGNEESVKNDENADKEKEKEEDDKNMEGSSNEMMVSEESFVDLDICAFGTKASRTGNELGELIKQLKIAPEILTNCVFPPVIAGGQIEQELQKLTAQKSEISDFIQKINSIVDHDD